MKIEDRWTASIELVFPEETLPHAHDTISGKFIHGDDIQNNEKSSRAKLASPEMKEAQEEVHGVQLSPPGPRLRMSG